MSGTWITEAACADFPVDWFFPDRSTGDNHGREAKAVCRGCPVRVECLEAAVASNEEFGVHGGAGEDLRRWLRRAWLAGPVEWAEAQVEHFARLDGVLAGGPVNRNGPGAECGRRVTYARGCRCSACSMAAALDGAASKVKGAR